MLGFKGLIWTRAGSQPDHAFLAPDGSSGSREDSRAAAFEFTRPLAEPGGTVEDTPATQFGTVRPRVQIREDRRAL